MVDHLAIGLLSPGSMGAALAGQLVAAGSRVHWLPGGRGPATRRRAHEAGLAPVANMAAMVESCGLIISVCPPAVAREVANAVASASFGGVYLEANAISPGLALELADIVSANGAQLVDGGIVGPPPHHPGTTRLYLSGPAAVTAGTARLFARTALSPTVLPGPVGTASALKLAFASYNKISFVLAAQAAALAAAHGVLDDLLELTGRVLPTTPLGNADRLISAAARAWRWAPEMREIADACSAAGLSPDVALAADQILGRWAAHKGAEHVTLEQLIDDLTIDRGPPAQNDSP